MVKDAPEWAMPPIPSPPVRQSTRSTTDQFKEHNFTFYGIQVEKSPTARILCDSWAYPFPDDSYFVEIVGLKTAPQTQRHQSTVSVDRRALATFRKKALFAGVADPELKRSLGRLNYLRSLPDGWLGNDSCGTSVDAGVQAERLLRRIRSEVPSAPLPVLGLDTDGTIVMSWSRGDLVGSMTVYGDGTFSYFVRRNTVSVKNIDAMIDQPLRKDLTDLLSV